MKEKGHCLVLSSQPLRGAKIPESEFKTLPSGLKYYDLKVGDGAEAVKGSEVGIHCVAKWKEITFMSGRQGLVVGGTVMKGGRIVQSGKYEDLIANPNAELVRQMDAHRKSLNQVNSHQRDNSLTSTLFPVNQIEVAEEIFEVSIKNGKLAVRAAEEETEAGRVKCSVYSTFVTSAYKGALVPVVLLYQVLFQGLQMGSNYWMACATEVEGRVDRRQLIGIFGLLSRGSSIFIFGKGSFAFNYWC